MTKIEHLLSALGEEGAEVAHQCSKANRFGLGDCEPRTDITNATRIVTEIYDLVAVAEMLETLGVLEFDWYSAGTRARIEQKKRKVEQFMRYAEIAGTLTR